MTYAEALASYDRALALDARSVDALLRRAHLLFTLDRRAEAIDSLRRAFELDPAKREEVRRAYPELASDSQSRHLFGPLEGGKPRS